MVTPQPLNSPLMISPGSRFQLLSVVAPLALALPVAGFFSVQVSPAQVNPALAAPHTAPSEAAANEITTVVDENGWRDASRPELRAVWDKLEGKRARELAGLEDWIGTDARDWDDLSGKVVLLDFWATWCGPCQAEIPKVQALHRDLGAKGFVALGVHASRGFEKMEAFVKKEGLTYAFAADKTGAFYNEYSIRFVPTYMVVDKRGILRVAGANKNKVREIVKALMAEPNPPEQPVVEAKWPAIIDKELYAKKDLRGKPAPALEFGQWLSDKPELRGKAILIDFWATWCPPCLKAIPELNELHESYGEDLVVIGLSKQDPVVVREFANETAMHYALACDTEGRLSDVIGVDAIPHVLFISTDRTVRWQGFPFSPEDPLTMELVGQLLDADPGVRTRRAARKRAADEAHRIAEEKKKQTGGQGAVGMQ